MAENPWFVDNIQSFLFLNCPECTFKTKNRNFFQDHATKRHPRSCALFENSFKSDLEDFSEMDFEYPIGIVEITTSDKTLEEIMFPEVQSDTEIYKKHKTKSLKRRKPKGMAMFSLKI